MTIIMIKLMAKLIIYFAVSACTCKSLAANEDSFAEREVEDDAFKCAYSAF